MLRLAPIQFFKTCTTLTSVIGTAATDLITKTAHGLVTGDPFIITFGSGFTGLTTGKRYYAIVIDANTWKVANTLALALAGTAIDITADGSGATVALVTRFLAGTNPQQTVKGGTFAAQSEGNTFAAYVGVAGSNGNIDPRAAVPQSLSIFWTQGGFDLKNYYILAAAGDGIDFFGHN